ncbi:hypothetical protein HMPREF1147_1344 [Selenomonas sp. FOBRC9]|uniref:Gp138 family membrane-puncturing spike protein n=1 Tax=Selenomonas sp. FOBRC9 TaxID=936573 RepID=UPI00027A632B|nr:Gp138 family membrane-puncturing spike protein [Selenomonas sp. FOBRC9]EJP32264.1 hypothetical protein HMPREF1147_1344 [Selenomonas sp. FOBRC9]
MLKVSERLAEEIEQSKREMDGFAFDLRVAAPGIIQSVDYARQTCTVRLAIRERMNRGGILEWAEIPLLPDVPFFVYSGGGYCLTLPIQTGDDCLVVFGDSCIDAWWQNGGVQNQAEKRRHDLSDGFALVGFRSQPHVVSGYSPGTAQLRNASGDASIEINGSTINIQAAGGVTISGGVVIDGRSFLGHTHGGVMPGGGTTGGVS